jgi:NAD(P)-dependent dehydrogenase (short-subunit alcohol dehydrogenase family)
MNEYSYFALKDRVALVTGASSGLGQHFAETLAAAGCLVGIAARRTEKLVKVAEGIEAKGGTAIVLQMDVTDAESVEAGLARLTEAAGMPTILVNNAGTAAPGAFLDATPEETAQVIGLNQNAPWSVAQSVCRRLVDAGVGGSIINIASITGMRTLGGAASYAVSKAALVQMTKVLALELARHDIRVNAIAPGYFATDLNREFLESEAGQKIIKRVPMRRSGQVEELDGALLLLASERGRFMTGSIIPVDGGHLVSGL